MVPTPYDVEIINTNDVKLDTPIMFIGLTGPAAVGSIAAQHIIKELKMKEIAHLCSPLIPPVTIFLDGQLRRPFRLFVDDKGQRIVGISEIPLPTENSYYIAKALTNWAQEKNVTDLVILDGIPVEMKDDTTTVFGAAEPDVLSRLSEYNIEPMRKGFIGGLRAAILNQCLTQKLNGMIFLAPVIPNIPDPLAASQLIKKVDAIYNLSINTDELLQEQEKITKKLRQVTENAAKMEATQEPPPSRYLA
jgi:uncharacterized protein